MIKSLSLKNFQKHEKLDIKFDAGVNCICGRSDAGKTSLLRALRWVAFNKPVGDAIITHGKKEVEATIVTDTDTVKRIKNKKRNGYDLNGDTQDAVGRDVPECVLNALNLTDLNFAMQHDPPFLISNTAGEVGKYLNSLVDLTVIDSTLSVLNSRIKDTRKRYKILKEQEVEQKAEVDKYADFDKASKKLDQISEQQNKFNGKLVLSNDLQKILGGIYAKQKEAEGYDEILQAIDTIGLIEKQQSELALKQKNCTKLCKIVDVCENLVTESDLSEVVPAISALTVLQLQYNAYETRKQEHISLSALISKYESAFNEAKVLSDTPEALGALEMIKISQNHINSLDKQYTAFYNTITTIEKKIDKQKRLEEKVIKAEREYHDVFGDVCPLCGKATGYATRT